MRKSPAKGGDGPLSREDILDAAEKIFAARGFGESTLADVSEVFGVTRQALYYYFPSKVDILYALYVRWFERTRLAVEAAISAAGDGPAERFEAAFVAHAVLHGENNDMAATFALERDTLPPKCASHIRRLGREMQGLFVQLYSAAVLAGEYAGDVPPDVAVALVLGAINWSYRWYRADGPLSPSEFAEAAHRLFSQGYLARVERGKRP